MAILCSSYRQWLVSPSNPRHAVQVGAGAAHHDDQHGTGLIDFREDVDIGIPRRGNGRPYRRAAGQRGHMPVCAPSLVRVQCLRKRPIQALHLLHIGSFPRRLAGLADAAGVRDRLLARCSFDFPLAATSAMDGLGVALGRQCSMAPDSRRRLVRALRVQGRPRPLLLVYPPRRRRARKGLPRLIITFAEVSSNSARA